MEMHQIRYFLAVCDTLNFTRAAEQCHVSQPALTRAVKGLEDEFGGLLFHRERNNTHLTELTCQAGSACLMSNPVRPRKLYDPGPDLVAASTLYSSENASAPVFEISNFDIVKV